MRVWGNKPDWDHLVNFPMTSHLEKFDCYFLKLFLFLFPFGDSSYMNIKVLIDVAKLFFFIILYSASFSLSLCCDFKLTNHFLCHI